MFTIPTDRVYKFGAVISAFFLCFFIIFPDVFAYYSKNAIADIEFRRLELSVEITKDSLRLINAETQLESQNTYEVKKANQTINSIVNKSIERSVKFKSLKMIANQQLELKNTYESLIEYRWLYILISIIFLIICICTWVYFDIKELNNKSNQQP